MNKKSVTSGTALKLKQFKSLFNIYDLPIFGGQIEIEYSTNLYNIEIDVEQFPKKFQNVLNSYKINQLGPILNLSYSKLILTPNLGNWTIGEVYLILDKILEEHGYERMTPSEHIIKTKGNGVNPEYPTLIDAVEAELAKLQPVTFNMFRSSLIDGMTDVAIAKAHNLSRERIRQRVSVKLQKFAVKLLRYKRLLEQELQETIIRSPKLIGDDYFPNRNFDSTFLTRVVANMYPELPFEANRLNLKYSFIFLRNKPSIDAIKSLLKGTQPVDTQEFVNQLHRVLPDNVMKALTVLLSWERIQITVSKSRAFISLLPANLDDTLIKIFSVSDQPLTFNQICRQIKSYRYKKSSLKTKLESIGNFYRIEKDLFGMKKHLPVSLAEQQQIINAAREIIQKSSRVVHITKLFENLKPSFPKLTSKYMLHSILKNSGVFIALKGMNLATQLDLNGMKKLTDLVIELLNSRGVPLHKSEIIPGIQKDRDFCEKAIVNITKKVPGLQEYARDFYGLSSQHASNLDFLSGCELYIRKITDTQLCPHTTKNDIQTFFKDHNLNKVLSTIHNSDNFVLLEAAHNENSFFVNKKWRYSSIVKTILFHQENCTLSDNLLLDYLKKLDIPSLIKTVKLYPHYISHSQYGGKFTLLTQDIVNNNEKIVNAYIDFALNAGNFRDFEKVTLYLNNKLNLSLTVFQTEAIYRIWARSKIKMNQ